MDFEWDEAKNRSNIRKHGFHFAEAERMFQGFLLVRPDAQEDWRGAMDWDRHDSRLLRLCGVRPTIWQYDPRHLSEKGKP